MAARRPERAVNDLPKAVDAIRKAGLEVPMITAGILDARSPHAEEILRAASALEIRHYRWGGFPLDARKSIPQQIAEDKAQLRDLEVLNKQHKTCAGYSSALRLVTT